MQSNFGAGFLHLIPPGATRPILVAAMQSCGVDTTFDIKPLHGQGNIPIEHGRGKGKIEIKTAMGRVDPDLYAYAIYGSTDTVGEVKGAEFEAFNVPGTSPYTYTTSNAATFKMDLGVFNPSTFLWLTPVASGPTTGQYSVNTTTGVYTFAAADEGKALKVCYSFTSASTGKSIPLTNNTMDSGPIFQLQLFNQFRQSTKTLSVLLTACQASKLSMPFKLDDWMLPSMDMVAQDDGTGSFGLMTITG